MENKGEIYAIVQLQIGGPEFTVKDGNGNPVLYRSREQGWREIIDGKIMQLETFIGIRLQNGRLVREDLPEDPNELFDNDEIPVHVTLGTKQIADMQYITIQTLDHLWPEIDIEHVMMQGVFEIEEDKFMKKIIEIHYREENTTKRGIINSEVTTTVAETIEKTRLGLTGVVIEYWVDPLGKLHELSDTNIQL